MSVNFYSQCYVFLSCLYPINSVFNKPRCCAVYLPQLSMSEVRCVLPCLCLKQLPSLAVKRDLVCLYLKLITYQPFDCCAACANHLNSTLRIPFFTLCLSQVISIRRTAFCLSCVNLTWLLLNLCCAVRESHVTSVLNFPLCCAVCASHFTSILSFTLSSSVCVSHVTSIPNFTLSSAVCATHLTSILDFNLSSAVCVSHVTSILKFSFSSGVCASHVTSIPNFNLSSAVCATHVTSILDFTLSSACVQLTWFLSWTLT